MPSAVQPKKPVIIVGAGLAGLVMAILFERMNIPYQIYERAAKVKPLGALMSLGSNILAVFEQLGIYDELIDISLPMMGMTLYKENMEKIGLYGVEGINKM
ncbi:hypothetical protein EMPS_09732 [Entomortierella parvispora]|uniref:FAD-binding domain-containing protein n=1 Tax=Entomortierella parvispora TaxID=205924 RepID=A0A9P3HJ49_9FUNG|nr:hypothetical protein EMPS_09732 [Entomortierella parvispora]